MGPRRYRAFSLIEVMIAVLVFTVGLLALASFQGRLIKYGTHAKQRTLAMNVAEGVLENMRGYYSLDTAGGAACGTDPAGYDDIANCADGSSETVGNLTFASTWTVVPYAQSADGSSAVFTADTGRPDFKMVTINVAWVDGNGESQEAELSDIVDSTSPFNSGRLLAESNSSAKPITPFDANDFPGYVNIDLGTGLSKGSTTPEPTIVNSGNNVVTSFDVITVGSHGNENFIERREEFRVLNCICDLDAGESDGKEPLWWNVDHYKEGAIKTKRTGTVVTSGNLGGQPAECTACCRDHHDGGASKPDFDPWRDTSLDLAVPFGFDLAGDHPHYNIVNGQRIMATQDNPRYLEACRMIRRNGFFEVATDLNLENLVAVPEDFPLSSNEAYASSIKSFVGAYINGSVPHDNYPDAPPSPTYSLTVPGINLLSASDFEQVSSRAIYIDFMDHNVLEKIKCMKADEDQTVAGWPDECDPAVDPHWLEIVPFYDLNVTALSNWRRLETAIEVSNSPISDIERSSFSRGKATVAQNHFNTTTQVVAEIEHSNTGLTDTNPVDPHDTAQAAADIDVTVNIGGTPPTMATTISGEINADRGNINVETVRVFMGTGDDCSITVSGPPGNQQRSYVCEVNDDLAGFVSVIVSDYNSTKITGNTVTILDRQICPSNQAYSSAEVVNPGEVANPDAAADGEQTILYFTEVDGDISLDLLVINQADSCPAIASPAVL